MNSRKIHSLQLLRAAGALAVVLFHSAQATTKYSPFIARSLELMKFSSFRVDVFFVISGFVTCYTMKNQTPVKFLRRRLERLAPTYWLCSVLVALMSMTFMVSGERVTWEKFATSITFLSLATGDFPLVPQGWTLEYEILFNFYIAAALFLTRKVWPVVVGMLALFIVIGSIGTPATHLVAFMSAPIMLEFLMGILIAQWFTSQRIASFESATVLIALIAVGLSSTAAQRPIYAGIPAAMIVLLAIWAHSFTPPRWILALGDASYSIYLIQVFTIPGCGKVLHLLLPKFDPDVFTVVTTIVTVIAGLAFYSHVESGIQRWIQNRRSASRSSGDMQMVPDHSHGAT